jgi:hypothetical protein
LGQLGDRSKIQPEHVTRASRSSGKFAFSGNFCAVQFYRPAPPAAQAGASKRNFHWKATSAAAVAEFNQAGRDIILFAPSGSRAARAA